ncbi:AraC family transcriptional regulator [Paenibacillus agri]|uniref:AraC family transcriptional regulator n=1 Tax=Paenibacillus agri TaxID=2744309 RepID=A0A850EF04_9BACL|nr:AraC family transcriptional regulator [Paenibacillus agri]NUU59348.1 AraC family transcriptional regulator [Paenibacillus agri]
MAKLRRDSLFVRMLLSFMALTMVLVVTMTLVFSNLYSKTLFNQLSREQIKGLETLSGNIDNLFREMDQIFLNLEINDNINYFLALSSSDALTSNQARIQIRNIRQINPYIHSIFVYNSAIKEFICEGELGFDAAGFLRQGSNYRKSVGNKRTIYLTRLVPAGNKQDFLTNKKDYTISIEYTNLSISGEQQTVIINIDENLFIHDYLENSGNELLIADAQGTLLAHTDPERIGGDIKDTSAFATVLQQSAPKGNLSDKEGASRSLVAFVQNQTTGWYILSKAPYSTLVKPIQDKRNGFLAVCLSVLLMCLAAIFLISKRLYIPVEKLTELFKRSPFHVEGGHTGDISFIQLVYTETLLHMRSLENENRSNQRIVKESYLRSLLTDGGSDEREETHTGDYRLVVCLDRFRLCLFRIDAYSQLDGKEAALFESLLFESISQRLQNDYAYEAVRMPKGEIAVLINESEEGTEDFEDLLELLESIQRFIASHGITVSVGLSDVRQDWDCALAYAQGLEMLQQRFVLGSGRIIHQAEVEETLTRSYGLPAEMEKKLVSCISMNDRAGFQESLGGAAYVLKGFVYSDAIQALFHLFLVCITQMNQTINDENKRLGVLYGELNLIFTEMETLEQAMEWLLRQFDHYSSSLDSIKQLKENKFYRKVEEIMQYIQQNYNDNNLSVEVLAERAGYTPNYLSKIFKEVTGINSSEYIRKVRIDKAKELLRSDEYRVSDVAELCGYTNSSHFYSAFKKQVGLTPSAYRELSLQDNSPATG